MAEDNFNGRTQNALFSVFDGHSGDKAASFCETNFPKQLLLNATALERGDTCHTIKEGKYTNSCL
jgi:serine/threonine protein phosphatase PrpC